MEREPLKVSPGEGYFYDLALTDVESIYGSQNTIDLVFTTNDTKTNPIKIHKILVFVQSQNDFKFTDKMTRHVKEIMKNNEVKNKGLIQPSSIRAIKQELLQTNHVPFVSWQEKYQKLLHVTPSNAQQVSAGSLSTKLNILQQFLLSNAPTEKDQKLPADLKGTLDNLRVKLTQAYTQILL